MALRLFWLFLLLPGLTYAQAPQQLSLEEALAQAASANLMLRQQSAQDAVAQAHYKQTRAVFLPQMHVSHTAMATTDPLQAFGFLLKQEAVTQAAFAPTALNDPERTDHFTTTLAVQQPVVDLGGWHQRRAAASAAAASMHQTERAAAAVGFEVKRTYFGLAVAQARLAVVDTALTAARTTAAEAERFATQGLLTQADVLAAQVHVQDLEAQRLTAAHAIADAQDQLAYVLGYTEPITFDLTDDLTTLDAILPAQTTFNPERSDLEALRLQTEAAVSNIKAAQSAFVPRVSAFGSYEWNDDQLLGTDADGWTIGARLTWSLFGGYRQVGALRAARAQHEQAELAYADLQLRSTTAFNTAQRQVTTMHQRLLLAETTVEQAQEALRIRTNRFQQGLEKTTDVLAAEVMLAQQRLNHLETLYRFHEARFQLEFLTERPLQP